MYSSASVATWLDKQNEMFETRAYRQESTFW